MTSKSKTLSFGRARISRILHPTDFSESSARAYDYARLLGRATGAELHVLHVVGYPEELAPSQSQMRKAYVEAEKRLGAEVQPTEDGETVRSVVRVGSPASETIRYAREEKIDLVVMGTVGLHGDEPGTPVGSVAEKVIRALAIPVLTVKAPATKSKAASRVCAMCAQPSGDVLCNACKDRVRGEAVVGRRK
jgi:nucleotide-binding universal stress UspA family protein